MGKSQSESHCEEPRGRERCLARARNVFRHCEEPRFIGATKQSQKGQPVMRQA
ncbi:MAG: hypothetical protein ABSF21_01805 [Dehalococcoidia bacterium]